MNSATASRRVGNSLPTRHIWPPLTIIILIVILTWACLRTNAAWHFLAARSITDTMLETGELSQNAIDDAKDRIRLALRHFPNQPDYLDLAGHLQEFQANQVGVIGKQRRELLESAAVHYRKALSVRPLWPYSWVNLLSVKDKLGQVDSEFNKALQRAVETGPWEPRVQLEVITSGVRHWDRLGGVGKNLVREKVKDAMKVQPRETFAIMKTFGRPDLVCAEAGDFVRINHWCEEVFAQGLN